jgi:hypothetical protein
MDILSQPGFRDENLAIPNAMVPFGGRVTGKDEKRPRATPKDVENGPLSWMGPVRLS